MAKTAMTEEQKAAQAEMLKNETKGDRFRRLGSPRVARAIASLRSLHALGGAGYESTEEQRNKIVLALRQEVAKVETALTPKVRIAGEKPTFDL